MQLSRLLLLHILLQQLLSHWRAKASLPCVHSLRFKAATGQDLIWADAHMRAIRKVDTSSRLFLLDLIPYCSLPATHAYGPVPFQVGEFLTNVNDLCFGEQYTIPRAVWQFLHPKYCTPCVADTARVRTSDDSPKPSLSTVNKSRENAQVHEFSFEGWW